jgi:hypothetical protein
MSSAHYFRDKAAQCRRLSKHITDREVAAMLFALASEFDAQASAVDAGDPAAYLIGSDDLPLKKPDGDGRAREEG